MRAVDNAVAASKAHIEGASGPVPAPETRRATGVPIAAAAKDIALVLMDVAAMVTAKVTRCVLQTQVSLAGVRVIGVVPAARGSGSSGRRAKVRNPF